MFESFFELTGLPAEVDTKLPVSLVVLAAAMQVARWLKHLYGLTDPEKFSETAKVVLGALNNPTNGWKITNYSKLELGPVVIDERRIGGSDSPSLKVNGADVLSQLRDSEWMAIRSAARKVRKRLKAAYEAESAERTADAINRGVNHLRIYQ